MVILTLYNVPKDLHTTDNKLIYILLGLMSFSLLADLLDGMLARLLNASSPIGLQLDSLADMVSFGVFTSFLMMLMIEHSLNNPMNELDFYNLHFISFLGLSIALFSALRLAKFNVDTTQTSYFKGLATPANTIFIFGIYILMKEFPETFSNNGIYILIITTFISSYLLISNLPLFSFKLKSKRIKDNVPQVLLILISLFSIIILGLKAISFIIICYIMLSIIFKKSFVKCEN